MSDNNSTTTTNNTTSPTSLEILSLLESYQSAHTKGDEAWRKTLWNLYKGRHLRQRNSLTNETYCSALDVREDLDPRVTVQPANDGLLRVVKDGVLLSSEQQEGTGKNGSDATTTAAKKKKPSPASHHLLHNSSNDNDDDVPSLKDEGLRNRRQSSGNNNTMGVVGSSSPAKWTVEQHHHDMLAEEDEEKDKPKDPLELLAGALPPKELKEAQRQAKQALDCYIEAANLLIQMQQKL